MLSPSAARRWKTRTLDIIRAMPTWIALVAITIVALGLRLLWLANTDTETPVLSDPQYYHATAVNIAEGRGYSVRVDASGFGAGQESEATAFWAPAYSALIAVPYALFGDDLRWAKLVNAIAGALACVPVFFIGRGLASERTRRVTRHMYERDAVGLMAASIVTFMPALIYWTPALFSDGVFMLGVASTLALAAWASERRSIAAYFAVGVALTATAFVRSQGVLLIAPVAVLVVPSLEWRDATRALAPIVAAIALGVVPWAVRNQQTMGEPYLISDNVCYNLRGAHAPYSTGTSVAIQDLWDEAPGISFKKRELLFDELGCERAWE
jgi:4-amino-4-deoxy-L-arabinose transferase-like glycosyltransferase